MTRYRALIGAAALVAGAALLARPAQAAGNEQQEPEDDAVTVTYELGADARTDRILRETGEYLSQLREFTFRAEILYDVVTPSGQKLSYGGTATASVRRPNGLHVSYDGDERTTSIVYDGGTWTFHNVESNVFAKTEVPGEIDAAVDSVFDRFGFSVPIADLVYSNPYLVLSENVEDGFIVGRHRVEGIPCHHLAFSQEDIDWQIWIEDGPRPLPRKLVITYRTEDGSPQYQATITDWELEPHFADSFFTFDPPAGSDEIEFLPTPAEEEEAPR